MGWNIDNGKFYVNGQLLSHVRSPSQSGEKLNFVIGLDGKLYLGYRHAHLAKLSGNVKEVQAAGSLTIKNGVIKYIDNDSGHFLPSLAESLRYRRLFEQLGVKFGAQTHLRVYGLDKDGRVIVRLYKKILDIKK